MSGAVIMVQGCASSVGKSMFVTGLCRLFHRRGISVAPFKSQNMSLNSAITAQGDEIGRAQAVQAEASGIEASVHMNPILLKPEGRADSQLVVLGKPQESLNGVAYDNLKDRLSGVIQSSLDHLRASHDVVVIEGAGSPAEADIPSRDIVNMHVARMSEAPVLLVGDIDRGGLFAHFVGTLELLPAEERALVAGLVVNKFRGNPKSFDSSRSIISQRTGVPVIGVVPYVPRLRLPDEDSLTLDQRRPRSRYVGDEVEIAIVRLPRLSNFDEFLPLEHEPGVLVRYAETPEELECADLVVLPGSKNTRSDLNWLREEGLDTAIQELARRGRPILGICGGYQILGSEISDPLGIEGPAGHSRGLGLLPVRTNFSTRKTTRRVTAERLPVSTGCLAHPGKSEIRGYEIHMGQVSLESASRPLFLVGQGQVEGCWRGSVSGTLLHGLLENRDLRLDLLGRLGRPKSRVQPSDAEPSADAEYERLADAIETGVDLDRVASLLGEQGKRLTNGGA